MSEATTTKELHARMVERTGGHIPGSYSYKVRRECRSVDETVTYKAGTHYTVYSGRLDGKSVVWSSVAEQCDEDHAELFASAPDLLRQRDELLKAAEGIRACETKPGENGTIILTASFDKLMALCNAIDNANRPTGTPSASTLEGLQDAVADSQEAQS